MRPMIKILTPEVIARIAAGEVVERPAAVVKELVENSLDAGATAISVASGGGGIGFLRVVDNGHGIPADQLELAFQRHATSKVSSESDLDSIATLGFRGEALPSIAAVAEVELVTGTGEASGSYISLIDGRVAAQGGRARSPGTTITVHNLFRNFPARLKFLRSTATENSHIANVVSQYALAYPEVKFSLDIDDKTIIASPGSGRLLDAVLAVHGLDTARSMIEIKRDSTWNEKTSGSSIITVTGMIGTPQIARASRDYLSFFVNRRWISGRILAKAVEDAFHGLLTVGKHPVAVLNIELPAREVDVNIHPAKSEVKFQNEHAVFGAVQKAVRSTLIAFTPVPTINQPMAVYQAPPHPYTPPMTVSQPSARPELPIFPETNTESPVPLIQHALPALRPVGQIAATYIVAEGPDGLYLIDQHAAHERIMFEKVQRQKAERGVEIQGLLEPATFEATPRQDALLKLQGKDSADSLQRVLAEYGFTLEPFGGTTYLIRAVPAGLDGKKAMAALRELLDTPSGGTDWREKIAQSLACHSAVRAGQVLGLDEIRELLRELEQTATPHTCPHGRPTIMHLGLNQLEKEFRRT
jgi:DNA mismatch repair protein MutL